MKDKIFLTWNSDPTIAIMVKKKLEEHDYFCYVGGNKSNEVVSSSIGEAVRKQMKECNQAIVILRNEKREDGLKIGFNTYYELGYAHALYGEQKIHCVSEKQDTIQLPNDLTDKFVEALDAETPDTFVENIVNFFLQRQKLTVKRDKFELINDRHIIRNMLKDHYSEKGSCCSDYELAQYILFYMLSAQMFRDELEVINELIQFKSNYYTHFSDELSIAVEFSIGMLKCVKSIIRSADTIYINYPDYAAFEGVCEWAIKESKKDPKGDFYYWINLFVNEGWNYAALLISQNPVQINANARIEFMALASSTGMKTLEFIKKLKKTESCKDNRDANGILALIHSYIARNQFLILKDKEYVDAKIKGKPKKENKFEYWLETAADLRSGMVNTFNRTLDTRLYRHFCIEYNLIICEYLLYMKEKIEFNDRMRFISEVSRFLADVHSQQQEDNVYIEKIQSLFSRIE